MKNVNENYEIPNQIIGEIADDTRENLKAASELGKEFMFQTLMDYGSELGDFPDEEKNDENLIHGCQSTVYISAENKDGRIFYKGFSDSKLVQGEVAILLRIFDGQKAHDIINRSKEHLDKLVEETDIISSLSPSRQNAFGSMYEHIKEKASQLS